MSKLGSRFPAVSFLLLTAKLSGKLVKFCYFPFLNLHSLVNFHNMVSLGQSFSSNYNLQGIQMTEERPGIQQTDAISEIQHVRARNGETEKSKWSCIHLRQRTFLGFKHLFKKQFMTFIPNGNYMNQHSLVFDNIKKLLFTDFRDNDGMLIMYFLNDLSLQ